jgi:hypothetical protein
MKIVMLKQFGNLRKGETHDRESHIAEKLVKLGYATMEKELKVEQTKEFKAEKKTK